MENTPILLENNAHQKIKKTMKQMKRLWPKIPKNIYLIKSPKIMWLLKKEKNTNIIGQIMKKNPKTNIRKKTKNLTQTIYQKIKTNYMKISQNVKNK